MYYRLKEHREEGFTLIELLIVILIIGILTAIAVPAFMNQRKAAAEAALKTDVRNAGTILEGEGKFTGTLPTGLNTSEGVQLTAMRTKERDNKVVSAQFVDGTSPNWHTFLRSPVTAVSGVAQNPEDGFQGMNYRRITTSGGYNGQIGQYVSIALPEPAKAGDEYTVGIAMRHNYTGYRNINIEFKDAGGGFVGGIDSKRADFNAGEWKYFTATGNASHDGVTTVVMSLYGPMNTGNTFDATGAVIVKGNQIDPSMALDTTGYDFCVQGYHESNPENIWRYSSLDGGLEKKSC